MATQEATFTRDGLESPAHAVGESELQPLLVQTGESQKSNVSISKMKVW